MQRGLRDDVHPRRERCVPQAANHLIEAALTGLQQIFATGYTAGLRRENGWGTWSPPGAPIDLSACLAIIEVMQAAFSRSGSLGLTISLAICS
jgi:hypothetical protein